MTASARRAAPVPFPDGGFQPVRDHPHLGLHALGRIRQPRAGLTDALSTTGNPVVALPGGRDEEGMPFGLQLVGPRRDDLRILRVAKALETAFAADVDLARPVPDPA